MNSTERLNDPGGGLYNNQRRVLTYANLVRPNKGPQNAPYIGVIYESKFGKTADFARASGETVHQVRFVFGIRAWL